MFSVRFKINEIFNVPKYQLASLMQDGHKLNTSITLKENW